MTALLVYALLISATLGAAAWLVDRLLRPLRMQTRFVWLAAMTLTVLLVALAPVRMARREAARAAEVAAAMRGADVPGTTGRSTFAMRLATQVVEASDRLPFAVDRAVALLWLAASASAFIYFFGGYRRQRALLATAPQVEVRDVPVRLSDDFGPAVVGVRRAEIVVPRWLLTRHPAEQHLVITHEVEHLRAQDPALLSVAAATTVLLAWSPIAWWSFARLRLAAELDCDARVLRRGTPTDVYGALLIDLTAASQSVRLGALAFAERPSQLERRLVAMTDRPASTSRRRIALTSAAAVALVATLYACASEPVTPERQILEERVLPREFGATPAKVLPDGKIIEERELPRDRSLGEFSARADVYFDFQVEEAAVPIPGSGSPRYPTALRSAGVSGEVLAQFVVGTDGRVDVSTFKAVRSSDAQFTQAIREALPSMRFKAAELGGKPVKQLIQQPFVFQLAK
ncbi:MAG: TonB family protein [Gemmatimonadaceae bacterium]|nr:TonB family protein [Gemmatimonadaceae bacterium]